MKSKIIEAAAIVAEKTGYMNVSHKDVGEALGVVPSHIQYYFPAIKMLRDAVVQHAVVHSNLPVLAQALSMNHEFVQKLDKVTKGEVARYIKGV